MWVSYIRSRFKNRSNDAPHNLWRTQWICFLTYSSLEDFQTCVGLFWVHFSNTIQSVFSNELWHKCSFAFIQCYKLGQEFYLLQSFRVFYKNAVLLKKNFITNASAQKLSKFLTLRESVWLLITIDIMYNASLILLLKCIVPLLFEKLFKVANLVSVERIHFSLLRDYKNSFQL